VFNTVSAPLEFLKETLKKIDKVDGVKIGMLYDENIVKEVILFLKDIKIPYIVLDPIIKSSSGYPLISNKGISLIKESLMPLSTFVTPNLEEAKFLTSEKEVPKMLKKLYSFGSKYIIITGVNGKDDYFFDGSNITLIKGEPFKFTLHGSGCFYSSHLLCRLLLGDSPIKATKSTKKAIENLAKRY
jgi:hydroxymethylpyrimidine kinase/phosphomethylpyrimidine kinase